MTFDPGKPIHPVIKLTNMDTKLERPANKHRLVTVTPKLSILGICELMTKEDTDAVLVIDNGRIIGVVTEHDIIHAFASQMNPACTEAGDICASTTTIQPL